MYVRRSAFPILLDLMRELKNPVDSQLWYKVLKDNRLGWYAIEESIVSQQSADGIVPTTLSGFNHWEIHPEPLRTELSAAQNEITDGWCNLEKARMLAGLIIREKPKVVVESASTGASHWHRWHWHCGRSIRAG